MKSSNGSVPRRSDLSTQVKSADWSHSTHAGHLISNEREIDELEETANSSLYGEQKEAFQQILARISDEGEFMSTPGQVLFSPGSAEGGSTVQSSPGASLSPQSPVHRSRANGLNLPTVTELRHLQENAEMSGAKQKQRLSTWRGKARGGYSIKVDDATLARDDELQRLELRFF